MILDVVRVRWREAIKLARKLCKVTLCATIIG